MSKSGSVISKEQLRKRNAERRASSLKRARACAKRFIAAQQVCGGCNAYALCGIGKRDRVGMENFLRAVDPDGQNIVVIALGPLGQ